LIDPDFTPEVPEQTTYISNYVDAAETALFSSNFTDPAKGWRAYFDEASAVNFYIVNDVMGNVDGGDFYSSDYLYKNDNNPLIYMGPVWDFDISSGNVNYAPILEAILPWMQVNAPWYAQWFKDPGFQADVATQWNALKNNGVFTAWLASIQQQAAALQQSQINNFGRWPMQGMEVWPNPQAAGSYSGEVAYFLNWLNLRIGYLDSLFNNKTGTSVSLNAPVGTMSSGSSVTLTAQVSGGNNPTGVVSFLASGLLLGVGSLNGGTATATVDNLPAGMQNLQAVYNGDNTNALSFSAVQPVNVGPAPASTATFVSESSNTNASRSFTASVIGNSGTAIPTGTITFSVDSQAGTAVTLDANGDATYALDRIAMGTHILTCAYSGDANYAPSSGTPITIDNSAPVSFRR
jgi:hypothetical protein